MPRESARARLVREYVALLDRRSWERYARITHGVEDDDDEEFDSVLLERLQTIARSRYLCPRVYHKQETRFPWFMADCSGRESLRSFRVDRTSFAKLVELIRENTTFTTTSGKKKMAAPTFQLMVFLKFTGMHGSDACAENLGALFDVASGSHFGYIECVGGALLEQYDDVVCWSPEGERKVIADRIYAKYDFPNCVGVMDGTLLPLAFQLALNGEDYFTRKGSYALNALICCGDRAKATYALTGWPELTHDNRVWTNSKLCRSPNTFFSQGAALARGRKFFSTKLAKIRIHTEHCIDLIKGRFQRFKRIRVVICNRRNLTRVIRLFLCAVTIHNLLVNDPLHSELADEV